MKIQRAVRGPRYALCLLSTLVTASRCRRTNEAAILSRHGHFFVGASYWFEGGFTSDPRHSTGSGALQPRVESRTPPKGINEFDWVRPNQRTDRPLCALSAPLQAPCPTPRRNVLRLKPQRSSTMSALGSEKVRTRVRPCAHTVARRCAPCPDRVQTWSRPCPHLFATRCGHRPDLDRDCTPFSPAGTPGSTLLRSFPRFFLSFRVSVLS